MGGGDGVFLGRRLCAGARKRHQKGCGKKGGVSGVLRIGKCGSLKEGIWKVLGAGKTGVGRRCRGERGGMVVGSKDGDGGFPQGEERPGGYI